MAKKRCPDCKKTYDDKEPFCPHCAQASEATDFAFEDEPLEEAPPPRKKKAVTTPEDESDAPKGKKADRPAPPPPLPDPVAPPPDLLVDEELEPSADVPTHPAAKGAPKAPARPTPPRTSDEADILDIEVVEAEPSRAPTGAKAAPARAVDDADILDIEVVEADTESPSKVPPAAKKTPGTGTPPRPAPAPFADEDDVLDIEAVEAEIESPSKAPPAPRPPARPPSTRPAPALVSDEDVLDIEAVEAEIESPSKAPPVPRAPSKPPPAKVSPAKPAATNAGKEAEAKKTQMGGKTAQPTKLASRAPAPTMLAPPDEDDIVEASSDSGIPPLPKSGGRKTAAPGEENLPNMDLDVVDAESVDLGSLSGTSSSRSGSRSKPRSKVPTDADAMDLFADEELVEGASEVNLGGPNAAKSGPSGLDLIAEAVESGVELDKDSAKPTRKRPAGDEEKEAADFLADESSAVNLGRAETAPNPFAADDELDRELARAEASSRLPEEPASGPIEVDEVLSNVPVQRKKRPASAHVEDAEDADVVSGLEEGDSGVVAVATRPSRTTTKPPRPKYGRRWLGGILLGLLLAAGSLAGLFFFDILKPELFNQLLGKTDPKDQDLKRTQTYLAKAEKKAVANEKQLEDEKKAKKALEDEVAKLKKQMEGMVPGGGADAKVVADVRKALKVVDVASQDNPDVKDLAKGVDQVVKALQASRTVVTGLMGDLKGAGYEAAEAKDVPTQVAKMIKDKKADADLVAGAAKALDIDKDKLVAAVKGLNDAKTQADTKLKKVKGRLEAALGAGRLKDKGLDEGVDLLAADTKKAQAEEARLGKLVKSVSDRLKQNKYLAANADKDEMVVAALDKVINQAVSPLVVAVSRMAGVISGAGNSATEGVAQLSDLARLVLQREGQLMYYKNREKFVQVHTPRTMLDNWIPALQNPQGKDVKELARKAELDANWVKRDEQASAADRAKADYILGLARRGQMDYAGAVKLLEKAAAGPEMPADAAWKKDARRLAKEMTDPQSYYRRYEQLKAAGRQDRMLAELAAGMKASPQKGSLLALSSQVNLDKAVADARLTGNKLDAQTPGVKEAQADANAALKAGAVEEAHYALGRVDELLGNVNSALKHYRMAAKYQGRDDLVRKYLRALGRMLLKASPGQADEKKGGKAAGERSGARGRKHKGTQLAGRVRAALLKKALAGKGDASVSPAVLMVVLNMILLTGDEDEDEVEKKNPNVEEAIQVANQLIRKKDPRGYLLLGMAHTETNLWTQGLMEYVKGMQLLHPEDEDVAALARIVKDHPVFKTPDSARPPQPLVAEKHYNAGLNYYWARKYDKAEAEFLDAVRFFGNDARYLYFLGLSRLMQDKRGKRAEAYESFRLGKRLEDQGNPDPADVHAALEKVQGKSRRILSRFRQP